MRRSIATVTCAESASPAAADEFGDDRLRRLADAWERKYGNVWHFDVQDGAFRNKHGSEALVYRVAPSTAFGFAKGDYGQTRWRFS